MVVLIDATNKILGRLASVAAKVALKGEEIIVFNAEKAAISGDADSINDDYRAKITRGNVIKGPFISKLPDRLVRRTIRGMLPWDTSRGREAFRRVHVFISKPAELKGNLLEIKEIGIESLKNQKYILIEDVCKKLGSKWQGLR